MSSRKTSFRRCGPVEGNKVAVTLFRVVDASGDEKVIIPGA
jgi:hypothetical protein